MPGSLIGELTLQPILEFVFQVLGYYIGRVVVAIFTLGRIKCDRLMADTAGRKLRWGGMYHRRGQRIYLTGEATAGVGILFIVVIVGGGILFYNLRE